MTHFLEFTKMAGAGNDFIVCDNRLKRLKSTGLAEYAQRLCDRRRSVGGDGLIVLEQSGQTEIRMRIFNPDGSEAEMCGNGVRCAAKFIVDHGIAGPQHRIETMAGIIEAEVTGNTVKARITEPKGMRLDFPVEVNGESETLSFVDTGVPHAVKIMKPEATCDVETLGRLIRNHEAFAPKGTNVNFVWVKPKNAIQVRTYERGVEAETQACGTGSTASALIAAASRGLKSPVQVHTQGGDILKIYFSKNDTGFHDVYLEGDVSISFEGRVKI